MVSNWIITIAFILSSIGWERRHRYLVLRDARVNGIATSEIRVRVPGYVALLLPATVMCFAIGVCCIIYYR